MSLELRDARRAAADREWLSHVFPLYLHDLSGFGLTFYTLDDRGVWTPDHRADWLEDDGDHPLIIVHEGRPVGFALVNQAPSPHMRPDMDFRLSEFFVLRAHRGREIGRRAARALFDRFRGRWEISALPGNEPAIGFWRRVVAEHGGPHREIRDETGVTQIIDTTR
jgi:aminoglycoside 6'-N-acetyltransferase I